MQNVRVGTAAMLVAITFVAGCGDDDTQRPRTATATVAVATPTHPPFTATAGATTTAIVASPTSLVASPTATRPTAVTATDTVTAVATPTATASAPETPSSTPTATATSSTTSTATITAGADGAVAPLSSAGRWFVDRLGRVVLLHGVNMVSKRPPFYPAAFGFGTDDATFLAAEGFNALRLGVDFRGLMPTPGIIETAYIEHLAETVAVLAAQHIFVLLDFHQDGFSPMFNGNGLPDWMAISDGLPNPPDAVFPLYYIQNPAMQRAFENFWADHAGPGGIGLQEYFIQGVEAVVRRFAAEPMVLGTELMNEPWPGATWQPCAVQATGCPDLEQQRLVPFYRRAAAAARAISESQFVFVEPFVLFNFGIAHTSLPGTDPGFALSFHSYALGVAGEQGVVANGVEAATRDGAPLLLTEFGASPDPAPLNRLTAEMEAGLVPWLFWSYDENIVPDLNQPPEGANLSTAVAALVRPYPVATTGTPTLITFDPNDKTFQFTYDPQPPVGAHYADNALTVISAPPRQYPNGYDVDVDGAVVTSAPDAALLTIHNRPDAAQVSVRIVAR